MIDFDNRDLYDLKRDIDNIKDAKRQDFGYREIHVEDLPLEPIEDEDKQEIEKMRKANNTSCRMFIFAGFLPLMVTFAPNVPIVARLLCFGLGVIVILAGRNGIISKSKKIAHAKYGVVVDRHLIISSHSDSNGNRHQDKKTYFDVAFPDDGTIIYDISCSNNEYDRVQKGQRILVCSFSGKSDSTAFSILKFDDVPVQNMAQDSRVMNADMQGGIQDSSYRIISEEGVALNDIMDEDMEKVGEVRRAINSGNILPVIIVFAILMIWGFFSIAIFTAKRLDSSDYSSLVILIAIDAVLIYVLVSELRKLVLPFNQKFPCAQYGIVVDRHIKRDVYGKRPTTFDVVFPESGTRINNITCLRDDYDEARKGQKVLVFAFKGHSTYAVLSSKQ